MLPRSTGLYQISFLSDGNLSRTSQNNWAAEVGSEMMPQLDRYKTAEVIMRGRLVKKATLRADANSLVKATVIAACHMNKGGAAGQKSGGASSFNRELFCQTKSPPFVKMAALIKLFSIDSPKCMFGLWARNPAYLIFDSRKITCFRARGSYFFNSNFSGFVRGFFLVT